MRLALLILAVCLHACTATAQTPDGDPIGRLRRALQATYPDAAARDRALKQCFTKLRTLSDLRGALSLMEWRESDADEATAAVDRANRAFVAEWFNGGIRRMLRAGNAATAAAALEQIARLVETDGGNAGHETARRFGADVALTALQGPPSVRVSAVRLLGRIHPDALAAVPALEQLLRDENVQLRQAAAEALADLIRNCIQTVGELGAVVQRPAPRSELVGLAVSVLAAVHHGLDDDAPEVRRWYPEIVRLAAVALGRLIADPRLAGRGGDVRPLEAEREELRPLVSALRDHGAMVVRALRDGDALVRWQAYKALEDLAHARWRWVRRLEVAGSSMSARDDWLRELLQQSVGGLADGLGEEDVRLRRSAADALEMIGPLALPALPGLCRALYDEDRFLRWSAVRILGKLGPAAAASARPGLTYLLQDGDAELRRAAAAALSRISSAQPADLRSAVPPLSSR